MFGCLISMAMIVNIAGFNAIIWSFLWENAFDCCITIVVHDVTVLLSWHHSFTMASSYQDSASYVHRNHKMYTHSNNYMILGQTCTAYCEMVSIASKLNIMLCF